MKQVFCDYCGKEIIGYKPVEAKETKPGNVMPDILDCCTECNREKINEINAVWEQHRAITKVIEAAENAKEKEVRLQWRKKYLEQIEKRMNLNSANSDPI